MLFALICSLLLRWWRSCAYLSVS